jgi:glycosyltransferase involved in cell wall biosynthesis
MKIGVYTIALNEEQFVKTWYESAKEADYLLIADTGSTDNTVALAESLGINVILVSIKPWRFDDARNASLAALPDDLDYCIALDMDEVLLPGWRKDLKGMLEQSITRPRYQYTWSWKSDGSPGLQYGGDKIHARHGYRWRHPVHEVLVTDRTAEIQGWCGLEIHHHPDNSKPRSQYHPLLKVAVDEDPHDDRNAYYYARELYFAGMYHEAAAEFRRHLSLPKAVWKPERAASMRYLAKVDPENASKWLLAAILEDPTRREALVENALLAYSNSNWAECYESAREALAITEKPLDYLCEEFAWGATPYDLAALSAYHLGHKGEAIAYGKEALALEPDNERLQRNLSFYRS